MLTAWKEGGKTKTGQRVGNFAKVWGFRPQGNGKQQKSVKEKRKNLLCVCRGDRCGYSEEKWGYHCHDGRLCHGDGTRNDLEGKEHISNCTLYMLSLITSEIPIS